MTAPTSFYSAHRHHHPRWRSFEIAGSKGGRRPWRLLALAVVKLIL
jgi:hypothetical protein